MDNIFENTQPTRMRRDCVFGEELILVRRATLLYPVISDTLSQCTPDLNANRFLLYLDSVDESAGQR